MKTKGKPKQISQIKAASRMIFSMKPTKVKPSKKLYSRKKKEDHSGIGFLLSLFF
ncbi:hypothetical protein ND856_13475 [Leptospira bandrabouensis]|uniref:hypothetical protein n=1 Tax=Leptospira bandrabouensis TaxID=2484903 RepID=UPI00142DCEC8|nr:hypothetical protein [Leptospira bandrabouensis]MCW7459269.1 hypothetical protein [Leptospira bandrabouensis]MCW7478298.1 hypothetical protein [Leptospira bandrabouensis]MCW7485580.1 hypothetical protein [Leptospira bandrabouensis]